MREYYRVQDVLEAAGTNWKAILEDYDTSTTNGRLNLNIRLSVAQDESDRTADRIKFVFAERVKTAARSLAPNLCLMGWRWQTIACRS